MIRRIKRRLVRPPGRLLSEVKKLRALGDLESPGTLDLTRETWSAYVMCMARKISTTVRLDAEDAEAIARARADGVAAADLIRRGLRLVAARYYKRRRPPSTGLFVSTASKLGDESELFRDIEE